MINNATTIQVILSIQARYHNSGFTVVRQRPMSTQDSDIYGLKGE